MKRGRAQLILVFAVAAASLLGAYGLFFGARGAGVWGTTNNGVFVEPPLTAQELVLLDATQRSFELGGRWWLWVSAPRGCSQDCAEALEAARQVQLLLHKDAHRVRRALLLEPSVGTLSVADGVLVLQGDLARLRPGAYIVDPLGNVVLWYSYGDVGKPLLDDLKRLLKVSQIG